jgi:hypothetical protein
MIIITWASCYFKHCDDQLFMFIIIMLDIDWDMAHDKDILCMKKYIIEGNF